MGSERSSAGSSSPGRSIERELDELLAEYTDRLRRGETPSLDEYITRRPDLAEDIRQLFPAMAAIEGLGGAALREHEAPFRAGDFRIVREIGRGGMGVVYEAVQESLGRRVALKILPQDYLGDAKSVERFRREARAAARLHHTSIVPVFGVGEDGGIHYYAMQFIEGKSLDQIIASARKDSARSSALLPPAPPSSSRHGSPARGESSATSSTQFARRRHHRAAARLGLQIAEALSYAHSQGILHRDIKPSNVLVDANGSAWIADFGLAKADDDESAAPGATLTRPGDIVGTIAYLAPERLEGKADARSDVYALGLTLYELITLEPAFEDDNRRRLLKKVAEETPVPPVRVDPSIPRDLETIILTATARDPARRYSSARRLADDLRAFLDGRPISARRATTAERVGNWCRREPALAALAGAVVLLLVLIATLSSIGYLELRSLLDVTESSLERARNAESTARDELRRSQIARAHASRIGGQPGRRFECLDAIRRSVELAPTPNEVRFSRNEAIAALALTDLRIVERWRKEPRMAFAVAPDAETYAESELDGTGVVVRRVGTREVLARIPLADVMHGSLRYSWDGRFLLARPNESEFGLVVVEIRSGEVRYASRSRPSFFGCDFQRASGLLAFVTSDADGVEVVDLDTSRVVSKYKGPPRQDLLAVHPNLERLALASSSSSQIHLVHLSTGDEITALDDGVKHTTLAWSPDGSLLAAARADGTVGLWELREDVLRRRAPLERVDAWLVATIFNERSSVLAVYGWDSILRLWDTVSGQLLLTGDGSPSHFTKDGRLALTLGTYEAALAEVTESDVCSLIGTSEKSGAHTFRISVRNDGRLLAAARADGLVLVDLLTRRLVRSPSLSHCESVLFSPGGESLLTGGPAGLERWRTPDDLLDSDSRRAPTRDSSPVGAWRSDVLHAATGDSSRWIAQSTDGSTLAILGEKEKREIVVLRREGDGWKTTRLGPHGNADRISLRPDGRALASGTWLGQGVVVWDTGDGSIIATLPVRDNAFVEYSPNGRWLAVMTPEACFVYSAKTHEQVARVEKPASGGYPGFAAFRGDSLMLAISYGRSSIRLVEPASGREVATLEAPGLLGNAMAFSPNGDHLFAALRSGAIYDWELARLRQELREMKLDWIDPAD